MFKKFLLFFLGLILIILVAAFVLLFTSFGNNILKPHLQAQIDKYSPIPLVLDFFSLRFGSFDIVLKSSDDIKITSYGTFSLLSQNIYLELNILLKNPLLKTSPTATPKELLIENVIRGKITNFEIHTVSNSLKGEFRIDTNIVNFKPLKVIANIKDLELESILALLGEKPYATGEIDVVANIIGDNNLKFNGQALAKVNNGKISKDLVKKDFGVNVPDNSFIINLLANFDDTKIAHKFELLSSVGNINSTGNTIIKTLRTDSTYDINISDLSPLTPIVGMPLRGEFRTNGKVIGDSKWINLDGKSDIADSATSYSISLQNYTKPKDATLKIKNLKIEKILYMLVKPIYANGLFNANANLGNISSGINGDYDHTMNGTINGKAVKSEFDMDMPNMKYNNQANINFTNGIGKLNLDLITDAANLNIKDALVNVDSLGISAPYKIDVKDLKKLVFVTSKELKGSLSAYGDVVWTPISLRGNMKSDLFGGTLDAELNNNLISATIKDMNTLSILDMLQYPKIFDSTINGVLKYDRQTQIGNIDLISTKGSFVDNKLMSILEKTLKFDGTKEVYSNIKIDGVINKSLVTANLNMQSSNTSITSNNATLNLDNDDINANLALKVQQYELTGIVSGKVANPSVKIDTSKLGKDILNNVMKNPKVQQEVQKIEDKAKDMINKGLNNLFKR